LVIEFDSVVKFHLVINFDLITQPD